MRHRYSRARKSFRHQQSTHIGYAVDFVPWGKRMEQQQFFSVLTGLGGLALLWIIIRIATRKQIWALAIGEDGRPSTSKLQMLIWTAAIVFAFLAIFQIRFSGGFRDALPNIPDNLLIAMGISVVTAVSAKSIAVNAANNSDNGDNAPSVIAPAASVPPAVAPDPVPAPSTAAPPGRSGIFAGDDGNPDLGKVQLMLWTFIAVGVFLTNVFALIKTPTCSPTGGTPCNVSLGSLALPDIGATLMILMGLGHGAYLGKKIAEN